MKYETGIWRGDLNTDFLWKGTGDFPFDKNRVGGTKIYKTAAVCEKTSLHSKAVPT
jgi:hypothetical protein